MVDPLATAAAGSTTTAGGVGQSLVAGRKRDGPYAEVEERCSWGMSAVAPPYCLAAGCARHSSYSAVQTGALRDTIGGLALPFQRISRWALSTKVGISELGVFVRNVLRMAI